MKENEDFHNRILHLVISGTHTLDVSSQQRSDAFQDLQEVYSMHTSESDSAPLVTLEDDIFLDSYFNLGWEVFW